MGVWRSDSLLLSHGLLEIRRHRDHDMDDFIDRLKCDLNGILNDCISFSFAELMKRSIVGANTQEWMTIQFKIRSGSPGKLFFLNRS